MTHLSEHEAKAAQALLEPLLYEVRKVIVGQSLMLERLLVALIAEGHVLVEGAPGLAKTLTLHSLSKVLDLPFKRIQFTPDLLPSDLIGTRIYNVESNRFETELGPVFSNFVLADEINRAPAKVQSALLEIMQERQVTIGKETFPLEAPFLVLATQNPIESEGTYALPEAQLDRFMMKLIVDYPTAEEELIVLQRHNEQNGFEPLNQCLTHEQLISLQEQANAVFLDPGLMQYIIAIVQATRPAGTKTTIFRDDSTVFPTSPSSVNSMIQHGASPRGAIALMKSAKALALINGRAYVTPKDVTALIQDCLRHRIILSYEALMEGVTVDSVLTKIQEQQSIPAMQGV